MTKSITSEHIETLKTLKNDISALAYPPIHIPKAIEVDTKIKNFIISILGEQSPELEEYLNLSMPKNRILFIGTPFPLSGQKDIHLVGIFLDRLINTHKECM